MRALWGVEIRCGHWHGDLCAGTKPRLFTSKSGMVILLPCLVNRLWRRGGRRVHGGGGRESPAEATRWHDGIDITRTPDLKP